MASLLLSSSLSSVVSHQSLKGIVSIPTTTTAAVVGTGSSSTSSSSSSSPVAVTVPFPPPSDHTSSQTSSWQQPTTDVLAVYESPAGAPECHDLPCRLNGHLIDVNPDFIIYTVKNGLLRIFHRHSSMRGLLRGHLNQIVTDLQFFHAGDVVGTIGNTNDNENNNNHSHSTLIIWRVYEAAGKEIGSERLLEISSLEEYGCVQASSASLSATSNSSLIPFSFSNVYWHPFNPNEFFFTHTVPGVSQQVATLVETTRIQTRMVDTQDPKSKPLQLQHAACVWSDKAPYCILDGAVQLHVEDDDEGGEDTDSSTPGAASGQLVDLCWSSRDTRHVLTVHTNSTIVLWDLKQKEHEGGEGDDDDDEDDELTTDGHDTTVLKTTTSVPKKLFVLKTTEPPTAYSKCLFLPHEHAVASSSVTEETKETITYLTTCFVTASAQNAQITVWSPFGQIGTNSTVTPPRFVAPTQLQQVCFQTTNIPNSVTTTATTAPSYVMNLCYGPVRKGQAPSSFLLLGRREEHPGTNGTSAMYALHLQSQWSTTNSTTTTTAPPVPVCCGIDSIVPFTLLHPVYSWSIVCCTTAEVMDDDDDENTNNQTPSGFDIKAFAYQSKKIQELTVTQSMCALPKGLATAVAGGGASDSNSRLTVVPLTGPYVVTNTNTNTNMTSTSISTSTSSNTTATAPPVVDVPAPDVVQVDAITYDEEEYDIADIADEEGAVSPAAPVSAASVPEPGPAAASSSSSSLFPGGGNPFANWLGGLAGTTTKTTTTTMAPPPSPMPVPPPVVIPPTPVAVADGRAVEVDPPLPPLPSSTNTTSPSAFLNPLDLIRNSQQATAAGGVAAATREPKIAAAATTKSPKRHGSGTDGKRNKSPKGRKGGRSVSPKRGGGGRSNSPKKTGGAGAGTQVTILQRTPVATDALLQTVAAAAAVAQAPFVAVPPPPHQPTNPETTTATTTATTTTTSVAATVDTKQIEQEVTKAVTAIVAHKLVPSIHKTIQESFATMARPLRTSMEALQKQGVTVDAQQLKHVLDIETPLKAELANTMRTVFIPTLEAITGQLLHEVQRSLPDLIPKPVPVPVLPIREPIVDTQTPQLLQALSQQIQYMNTKMELLTTEIAGLKMTIAEQQAQQQAQQQHAAAAAAVQQQQSATRAAVVAGTTASPSVVDPNAHLIQARNEVTMLLREHNYEEGTYLLGSERQSFVFTFCSALVNLCIYI